MRIKDFVRRLPVWTQIVLLIAFGFASYFFVWLVRQILACVPDILSNPVHVLFMSGFWTSAFCFWILVLISLIGFVFYLHGRITNCLDRLPDAYDSIYFDAFYLPVGCKIAIGFSVSLFVVNIWEVWRVLHGASDWFSMTLNSDAFVPFVILAPLVVGMYLIMFALAGMICLCPVPWYFLCRRILRFIIRYLRMLAGRSGAHQAFD